MSGASLEDVLVDATVGLLGFSCSEVSTDGQISTPTFNVTPMVIILITYTLVT